MKGMLVTIAAALLLPTAQGQDPDTVVISIQKIAAAIPVHIGIKEGYFAQVNVEVEQKVYSSGAPQVQAAVDEDAWDIGVAGVVPNIIGGAQGLWGIGIGFDQSSINQLVANAAGFAAWPLSSVDGVRVAVSPNSTGDYVVQACLKELGHSLDSVSWVYEQQSGIIEALEAPVPIGMQDVLDGNSSNNGTANETPSEETASQQQQANYGGLWAPHSYRFLEDNPNSTILCHGGTVYKTVTGGIMVRQEFAQANKDVVLRVLAAWLRGIVFMKDEARREETIAYMQDFYNFHNVPLSRQAIESELGFISLFDLQDHLQLMKREGDPPASTYDFWTREISEFMLANKVVSTYPEPADYIFDTYVQEIDEDPWLQAFAKGADVTDLVRSGAGRVGAATTVMAMLMMMMMRW